MDAQKKDWMKKVLIGFAIKVGVLILALAIVVALGIYLGWTKKEVVSGISYTIFAAIVIFSYKKPKNQEKREEDTEPIKVRAAKYIKEHKKALVVISIIILLMLSSMLAD